MAKNPVVHLDGAEELNQALRTVGHRTTGLFLKKAAQAGADVIAAEAKVLAPVDEGDLAASIHTKPGRLQQGRAQFDVRIGKNEWYGKLVELGTDKMAAQPFLRPAFDSKQAEAEKAIADVLRDALSEFLQ